MTNPHCRIGKIRLKGPRHISRRLPKKFAETTLKLMAEVGKGR